MTRTLKSTALGLVLLGTAALPAMAGDWHNGAPGIKDMRGVAAVPVPAPRPIPVSRPEWYFRADMGLGLGSDRDASETGLLFGHRDAPGDTGPVALGTRSSWFNSDFDTFVTYGGGIGYYVSNNVRADVTVEAVSMGKAVINGTERYVMHGTDATYSDNYGPTPHNAGTGTRQVNVRVNDETKVHSFLTMLNGYYDLGRTHGFTPYVGAGLGVAAHRLSRTNATLETTCDLTTSPACSSEALRGRYGATGKQTGYSLAAAFTAGLSYDISEITALDFNYRYLYVEGADATLRITNQNGVTSASKVSIGEASEHQLRAGLRFNIN